MARSALFPLESFDQPVPGGSNRKTELNVNPDAIEAVLGIVLKDDILPKTPTFRQSEAPAYAFRRSRSDYDAAGNIKETELPVEISVDLPTHPTESDPVTEDFMDSLFWQSAKHVAIVQGEPGCGKTTLIRYYLQCHCPFKDELGRHEAYKKMLIVSVDFRAVNTIADIHRLFFEAVRRKIEATPDFRIEAEHDYDFYEPLFRWTRDANSHEEQALEMNVSRLEYRRRKTQGTILPNDSWVDLAFGFLSRHEEHFRYVVFFFDNLDQSPIAVQVAAVRFALIEFRHRYPELQVWKLVLPLWPQTLAALYERTTPLLEGSFDVGLLHLPGVDVDDYFQRRLGSPFVAPSRSQDADPARIEKDAALRYVHSFYRSCRMNFLVFINNLAGSDTRRRRDMITTTLRNEDLIRRYSREGSFRGIGVYALLDALLKGRYPAHHRTENPLANLFYGIESTSEFSLLIGFHLFDLLRQQPTDTLLESEVESKLMVLGHQAADALEVLGYFSQHGLIFLRQTEPRKISIRRHAIRAYEDLLTKSAYIDNMAASTPVPSEVLRVLRGSGSGTDRPERFFTRKRRALDFLDYVRLVERAYVRRCLALPASDLNELRDLVKGLRFKSIFQTLASSYRKNLHEERTLQILSNHQEWDSVMSHPVIDQIVDSEKTGFPEGLFQ